MKKFFTALLLVLACAALSACTGVESCPAAQPEALADGEENTWGVVFTAKDVTPNGLTLLCTQSGDAPGELTTGAEFTLQIKKGDAWESVPVTQENCAWTMEAYLIPADGSTEWKTDWQWLYGTLQSGQYRIGKTVTAFIEPGNSPSQLLWAEFTIE